MSTICYVEGCGKKFSSDEIFDHVETYHRECLIEILDKEKDEFKLSIDKIKQSAYLIQLEEGLYWYIIKKKENSDNEKEVKIGLFLVEPSEPIEYHIRVGEDGKPQMISGGPFDCDSEFLGDEEEILVRFTDEVLELIDEFKLEVVRLVFQPITDEEIVMDMEMDPSNINWFKDENIAENKQLAQDLTCPVCMEPMLKEIYSCVNNHPLCRGCLETIYKKNNRKVSCPVCRGAFASECRNLDAEFKAKLVVFDEEEAKSLESGLIPCSN